MKRLTHEQKLAAALGAVDEPFLTRDDTRVVVREGWLQTITPSSAGAVLHEVIRSRVPAERVDAVIDEVVSQNRAMGKPTKWCVGPWTEPADFGDHLTRRGFRSWAVRGMGIDTDAAPAHDAAVEVHDVCEGALDVFVETSLRGWNVPSEQAATEMRTIARELARTPRRTWLFTAHVDGEPAGTAGVVLRENAGYLFGTQVLERFRGRGVYRALVAARLGLLRARGVAYAVTHAREATSAPMLEHLGLETLFRYACHWLDP